MNKIYIIAFAALLFNSCADPKEQEKKLLDEVINLHDQVMAKDGQLMKNKMQLDTLLKAHADSAAKNLSVSLDSADAKMEDWMHKFDAENKGKSHEEIMTYLEGQKKQIAGIEQQFDSVINASTNFLKTAKKK
ncbi:hypothetical protein DYU05_04355 [Mucilaginibacter terrenus]|uniref:Viral A-type inclusion protein n=1 Tax=Mucilaginibacter terrenus TaxID=2482727 RepID=A0A3E2NV16_9SPHI|nr:hypothetical protein [Mucilaginibacter terrenus]RFZ84845.1 hypothetical protein DYU05_04355 [Mucilaginibacter terrenus]